LSVWIKAYGAFALVSYSLMVLSDQVSSSLLGSTNLLVTVMWNVCEGRSNR